MQFDRYSTNKYGNVKRRENMTATADLWEAAGVAYREMYITLAHLQPRIGQLRDLPWREIKASDNGVTAEMLEKQIQRVQELKPHNVWKSISPANRQITLMKSSQLPTEISELTAKRDWALLSNEGKTAFIKGLLR